MKNLIIIRHAKSCWTIPVHDKERALSNQGIKDAHLISQYSNLYLPKTFLISSSTAKRASDTAVIFAQNFSYPISSIQFKDELYTFDEDELENVIKSYDNKYESVVIFGHNNAITKFVNKFGDVPIEHVPTSGFVSLEFDTDNWSKIEKAKTNKIIFPKDLKEKQS